MLDLEATDTPTPHSLHLSEQITHLRFECEIFLADLGPGPVLATELDCADHTRRRIKNGFAVADEEPLDDAEVQSLHDFN